MITFPFIILRLSLSKIKLEVIIKFKCSEVIHVNIIPLHFPSSLLLFRGFWRMLQIKWNMLYVSIVRRTVSIRAALPDWFMNRLRAASQANKHNKK